MSATLKEIASFTDPIGKVLDSWIRPNVIFKKMFVLSQKYSIDKNSFSGRSFLNEVY